MNFNGHEALNVLFNYRNQLNFGDKIFALQQILLENVLNDLW
jgi:hypothetical protein